MPCEGLKNEVVLKFRRVPQGVQPLEERILRSVKGSSAVQDAGLDLVA